MKRDAKEREILFKQSSAACIGEIKSVAENWDCNVSGTWTYNDCVSRIVTTVDKTEELTQSCGGVPVP